MIVNKSKISSYDTSLGVSTTEAPSNQTDNILRFYRANMLPPTKTMNEKSQHLFFDSGNAVLRKTLDPTFTSKNGFFFSYF